MYELAEFEKLTHLFVAITEACMTRYSARARPRTLVVAEQDGEFVSYALFFHNFSTFLGKRGLYLEENRYLYERPTMRGSGLGTLMLKHLAALAVERQCGRFEWSGARLEPERHRRLLREDGRDRAAGLAHRALDQLAAPAK